MEKKQSRKQEKVIEIGPSIKFERERERERERKLTTISLKRLASFGGRKAPILAVAETKNESMCFGGNEEERERVQLCCGWHVREVQVQPYCQQEARNRTTTCYCSYISFFLFLFGFF